MSDAAHPDLVPAREVARTLSLTTAANGLRSSSYGFTEVPSDTILHIVEAVPPRVATALRRRAYYFVPLALGEMGEAGDTEIAIGYTLDLSDRATCHRNVLIEGVESTFISTRLMQDKFALAFEFFINIGHQFVDTTPVPQRFQELLWAQAKADVRGETSQDAWEARKRALDAAALTPNSAFAATLHAAGSSNPSGARANLGDPASAGPSRLASTLSASTLNSDAALAGTPHLASETLDSLPGTSAIDLPRPGAPHLVPAFSASATQVEAAPSSAPRPGPETRDPAPGAPSIDPASPPEDAGVHPPDDRPATAFFETAFADTLAIYMLSLAMDLDYADLREREYPLLAAPALADRLRLAADLFPPSPNYEFAIKYRRRH